MKYYFFCIVLCLDVFGCVFYGIYNHRAGQQEIKKASLKDSIHIADSATIEHLKYAIKVEDDIINKLKQHK